MLASGTFLAATGAIAGGTALAIAWGRPYRLPGRPYRLPGRRPELEGAAADLDRRPEPVVPAVDVSTEAGPGGAFGPSGRAKVATRRPMPGDPDLYLDLDAVEVEAVYVLGTELFTHLKGGVGERKDLATGTHRHIETSDVSLTWRCAGRRSAEKLAAQLNDWESKHTPLRLLAACGRSALLMEDDDNWLILPELRLAV